MIAMLTGRIAAKSTTHVVLDVGGVGFSVAMSTASIATLPAEGDEVTVHTHLHVREDELALFGFESAEEKGLFEQLITVSGVGPKVALSVLSSLSPAAFADAVATEDVARLSTVPGIGRKTAQRMILDLKDRLSLTGVAAPVTAVVLVQSKSMACVRAAAVNCALTLNAASPLLVRAVLIRFCSSVTNAGFS